MAHTELERQIQAHDDYTLRTLRDLAGTPTGMFELQDVNSGRVVERGAVDRYLVVMGWLKVVNERSRRPDRDKAVTLDFARGRRTTEIRNRYMRPFTNRAVELVRDKVLSLIEARVAELCGHGN
jgi:hypothetical protein